MDSIVLDASAVLAMLQHEPGGERVMALLEDAVASVMICSVNLCEVVTKLIRDGVSDTDAEAAVAPLLQFVVGFDGAQAMRAAQLYRKTWTKGLSLGDRACLALSEERKAVVWTTDRAWMKLRVGVPMELVRS